jgi:hypothetical protein
VRRVPRALLLLSLAVMGIELVQLAHAAWLYLRSPYSRDYGEGCVLGLTQLLAERGTYFLPLVDRPLVHGIYPPVFMLLILPFHVVFGPTLVVPRLLSVVSTMLVVLAAFRLLREQGAERPLAVAFALLLPVPWFVQSWAPLARVDMLALLFSMAGLLVEQRTRGATGWRRYTSFPLFWLAFFTKQSALLAPAAVVVGWLAGRDWVRLRRDLPVLVVPPVLMFGALAVGTSGQAWLHLGPYTAAADYDVDMMLRSMRSFAVLAAPAAAVVLLGASCARLPPTLVAWWTLGLASLLTLAKAGAAQNYMIEPWAATVVLAGIAAQRIRETSPALRTAWPALLLPAALGAALAGQDLTRLPLPIRNPAQAVEFAELDRLVREAPGTVLSENLSLLVLNGRPVEAEPFALLLLQRKGLWNPRPLVDDCRAGRFALVVHEHRLREIPGIAPCLDELYLKFGTLGPYEVYRPR